MTIISSRMSSVGTLAGASSLVFSWSFGSGVSGGNPDNSELRYAERTFAIPLLGMQRMRSLTNILPYISRMVRTAIEMVFRTNNFEILPINGNGPRKFVRQIQNYHPMSNSPDFISSRILFVRITHE